MRPQSTFGGDPHLSSTGHEPAPAITSVRVSASGLRVYSNGAQLLGHGLPTVVFENGLGSEIGSWGALLGRVAKFAPVFAYDRPGIGGSEATNYRPTPSNVASLLHGLLSHTGAKPPFVLVGFSLGGAYVRMYAALYPDDVAGIVYIDPLDFTETRNDMLSTFVQAGLGEAEMRQYDEALDRFARDNSSQPVIAEWEEFKTLQLDSYVEYTRIAPTPQVPQVLLASAKGQVPFVKFSFDFAAWANIANQQSLHRQLEWILSSPDGHFVATSSSPHKIHGNDQDLVVWAIRRLVFPDPAKRLRTLIDSGGQELISAEYRRLKATYPPDNLSDDILNLLGYELLYLERVDEALIVFKLNVEEFPDAWNPYDSLGEAFAVRGDLELAIQNYRRSLELNPENANGASRLSDLEIRLRSGEKLKPPGRPTTR